MNDDLVGIGGLLGCIVLLVRYALAIIGAKTKQQPSKSLTPIQPRSTPKIPNSNVVNLTYRRDLREVLEWSAKGPRPPDFSTRHTDPDFWGKYREWWYYYD